MSSPQKNGNESPQNEKYTLGLNTIIVTEHVNTYSECAQTVLCVHEKIRCEKNTFDVCCK